MRNVPSDAATPPGTILVTLRPLAPAAPAAAVPEDDDEVTLWNENPKPCCCWRLRRTSETHPTLNRKKFSIATSQISIIVVKIEYF